MKALLISPAFPPMRTGGADFVHRLATEMSSRGVTTAVITAQHAECHDDTILIERVGSKWNWQAMQHILRFVAKWKPDVVDIVFTGWMYQDHPAITFLPTLIKQRFPAIRIIMHLESLGGIRRDKSNLARAAARYLASVVIGRNDISYEYGTLLRDSDGVITLSERDRSELILKHAAVALKCTTVAPPPIMPVVPVFDASRRRAGRSKLGLNGERDLLLAFYGYVYPGKGIETLFEAVRRIADTGINVKLLLIGGAPEKYVLEREGRPLYLDDLRNMARDLKIHERVIWSDYAPFGSSEPSMKLRLADAAIFPFKNGINQHNSSIWFVAAHGLPIIASKGETTESIFVDKQNVIFVLPEDPAALKSAIETVVSDTKLSLALGANAEKLAMERFSWTRAIDEILLVLRGKQEVLPRY